jgi:inorganic pyrophosphatase
MEDQTFKVLIEIPEGESVKYELDEETNLLMVDRLLPTAFSYPVNYGLIIGTKGQDGDALDALVFLSKKVSPNVAIECRAIGLLEMEDEEGIDHKVLCVPKKAKVDPVCGTWTSLDDIPESKKSEIRHFFEHYKDLEEGKWVKLKEYKDASAALAVIQESSK